MFFVSDVSTTQVVINSLFIYLICTHRSNEISLINILWALRRAIWSLLAERSVSKTKRYITKAKIMENIKAEMQNIEAELESVKAHQYSNVCVSKISNFQQSLQEAKDGVRERIVSDQFYTAPQGYRLGESDAILPWPCTKKVIFTVIDQQENVVDRENISKSMILPKEDPTVSGRPTCSNDGCGFDLASHKKLGTRKYVVDDTLFLRVEISD